MFGSQDLDRSRDVALAAAMEAEVKDSSTRFRLAQKTRTLSLSLPKVEARLGCDRLFS